MLTHIQIQDFAIIEHLELDLADGMTAITGETGAGKSIMLDAIGLVLGDRAEASMVRHGASKADISVSVDIDQPEILSWLESQDFDADGECILRRVITAEGRSRAYINGSTTTVARLRELGEQLVNIHGQHAHQTLIKPGDQRDLLDSHGKLEALVRKTREAYTRWDQARQALDNASDTQDARQSRIDLLKFQHNELEELGIGSGEMKTLEADLNRLTYADRLKKHAQSSFEQLYEAEDASIYNRINHVLQDLRDAASLDDSFVSTVELLESAQIQIEEAAHELRDQRDRLESDPEQLALIETRFNRAQELARKHHILPEALPDLQADLLQELQQLESPETSLEAMQQAVSKAEKHYDQLAARLTKERQQIARKLEKHITAAMQELGMEGGKFGVEFSDTGTTRRSSKGNDRIQFMVSANPGQPLKPLNSVASGGELSRISLAIQLVATRNMQLPTLIFDEVDSGIGGAVAEVVGRQLRSLGERCQVFCVTHLPQVASFGHYHLQVLKTKSSDGTQTQLTPLVATARTEEIARMLGGSKITPQTLAHAREMLKAAQEAIREQEP